uniref:Early nodulin n=2 Tax=Oryza glaberrima TaxID=4538 RepID=I1NYP2_ORYGL
MAARSFQARSPKEESDAAVHEAVTQGLKNAAISGTVVAVPTLVGCRVLPWAKANLNYTAQALIISAACIAGFFITADKAILRNARQNTIGKIDRST